jgi:hypothetical protein
MEDAMGLVRGVVITLAVLIGVVIGVVGFLVVGLFAISPPDISPAAPGQPWDVTLDMSDTFLSTQLNNPQQNSSTTVPIALSNAKAAMRADGTVTITGNVGLSGGGGAAPSAGRLPVNPAGAVAATIVLRPTAANGKLTVQVVSAQLGPLPVPANLGALLEGPVNNQIANALSGQSFSITELTVRDGAMLVRAKQGAP